ncbi:reticulon-4-interacting protein 1 homolog, mitochondrial-like [Euwallacea fornicatus]|uniref:reticulon-4-interacting protein 1 homolog, mitochondrial-like n=1 Tax=Euwallacea fornicatus TaxID=995702 RepID=UPI0033904FDF
MILRRISQQATKPKDIRKILSWTIHSYGDLNELQLIETRIPIITNPDDVLVQVKAASLNPIDLFMLGGYGRTSFQMLRNNEIEFPLILGRDFSGTIIGKGHEVTELNVGDEVYGFLPPYKQGSFTKAVIASKHCVLPKPKNLSHTESGAVAYATMTAWSGLFIFANMINRPNKGLKVLVLGGSGGVGTAAIQLLKSQGCVVYTTCSKDAIPLVTSLNPDVIFDKEDSDFEKNVQLEAKYNIILDAAKVGIDNIPNSWKYESYVTLNSPLLVNNDNYGLVGGLIKSAGNLTAANASRICSGKTVRWGYILPSNSGFKFIHELICQGKIRPIIQEQFGFNDLPLAMETLQKGHARGKIVLAER